MPSWPAIPRTWTPDPVLSAEDERRRIFLRRRAGAFQVSLCAYRSDFAQAEHGHPFPVIDLNLGGWGAGRCAGHSHQSVPGEVEVFPAATGHSFACGDQGMRTMHVSMPELEGAPALSGTMIDPLLSVRHAVAVLRAVQSDWWDPVACESACYELVGSLDAGRLQDEPGTPGWLRIVLDVMHATTDRAVSLAELGIAAGVHPGTITRGFRRVMGRGAAAYHRRLRVSHAVQRLAKGEPAARVAIETGFADQAHLVRMLRATVGVTPGVLRSSVQCGEGVRERR